MLRQTPFRSAPLRSFSFFKGRKAAAAWAAVLLAGVLLARAGHVSVLQHEELSQDAEDNLLRSTRLSAPRGVIFDATGQVLAVSRKSYSVFATRFGRSGRDLDTGIARLRQIPELASLLPGTLDETLAGERIRKGRVRILRRVPQSQALGLIENAGAFPGLTVVSEYEREYPLDAAAALLVGETGPIPDERFASLPEGRYQRDDEIGLSGIESVFEARLSGTPGREIRQRDPKSLTGWSSVTLEPAQAGSDLFLTLRADWQREAVAMLGRMKGSIIVMDAQSGALAVVASSPSYSPNGLGEATPAEASRFHRAVRGLYPPGSTLKPFITLAGLGKGIGAEERIVCTGSFRVEGWDRPFYCNVRSGHGAVNARDALKVSCNVYFYQLAQRLGIEPLLDECREMGFGDKTGADVAGEEKGQLSTRGRIGRGEAINLSIGQGTMLVTPLQVARAYASLANGSHLPWPHVVSYWSRADGSTETPAADARRRAAKVDAGDRATVIEGMWRVVNAPGGTAYKAGFDPSWEMCGKTGTAENAQGGTDAWFAGFYPRLGARWVVLVHLENEAGHGGEVAAPIAARLVAVMEGVTAMPAVSGVAPAAETAVAAEPASP